MKGLIRRTALAVLCLAFSVGHAQAQVRHPHAQFRFQSVGIVNGQSLVLSLANLHSQYPPDPCRIVLIDAEGTIVFDTGTFELPAVQTHVVTVNWGDLPAVQDQVGRKQVRAVFFLQASTRTFPPDPCAAGVEIIRTETGETLVVQPRPAALFLP